LFAAVVEQATTRFSQSIMAAVDPDMALADGQQAIGEHFLTTALTPRSLAFFRLIEGEGRKFPENISRFLRVGNDRVRAGVSEYLMRRSRFEGFALSPEDAETAGSFFVDMVRARHQYRALANQDYTLTEAEIRAHVALAVRFILNGVLPRA
ncbi:MAG: TetR/AcrR family transcriptional regulator C-terminal domain-containing protein, partial [Hyphomonadaceae bacterium]